ncbi:MAG: hypothetical protein ACOYL4_00400 [Miltoncostaeaceae bacterium]
MPRALKIDPVHLGEQQTGRYTDAPSKTRTRPAGGMWGAAAWLSASNREAHEPRLTVAPSGVATGVWKLATGRKVVPTSNFWLQGMSTATPAPG